MIKTDYRCQARLIRCPRDPRDAAMIMPRVPVDALTLKYQKPL
jgi:hypothetical protein